MDRFLQLEQVLEEKLPLLVLRKQEPMQKHTAFRIGGPARLMAFPKSKQDLSELCRLASTCGIKPYFMGNGSNLLVADEGLDALVIKLYDGLSEMRLLADGCLFAESGVLLSKVASFAKENSLSGLEFAHGIPGTVGGAVMMNAGAYGGEMKDVVIRTEFCDVSTGMPGSLLGNEHQFAYRNSAFSDGSRIITGVYFQLKPGDPIEIEQKMGELAHRRRESQPLEMPSAGSTFKRPAGHYAAALIDQAGLKGFSVGGAQVSSKHAGFVVNYDHATCQDVLDLISEIKKIVKERFGVLLELEVKIWPSDMRAPK